MVCQSCGRLAPTKKVTFIQNIGMIIVRQHGRVSGNFCRQCINRFFWNYTLTTLFLGWWGLKSFIVTPFILLHNIVEYLGARELPESFPPPLTGPIPTSQSSPQPGETKSAGRTRWGILFLGGIGVCVGLLVVGTVLLGLSAPGAQQTAYVPPSANTPAVNAPPSPAVNPLLPVASSVAVAANRQPTATPQPLVAATDTPASRPADHVTFIAKRKMYVCVDAANVRNGPGLSYSILQVTPRGASWMVYGTLGDWYYVGNDERGDFFIQQSALCNAPTPTAVPPTAVPRTAVPPTPDIWANYVELPQQRMYVCVPRANMYAGPGYGYRIVETTTSEWSYLVFGRIGDWYYLGRDANRVDHFMHRSTLCAQPLAAQTSVKPTTIARVVPTASAYSLPTLVRLVRREFRVCVPYAALHQSPDVNSTVIDYIHKDGWFPITGKAGAFYFGSYTDRGMFRQGYVLGSDLCDPDPGLTLPCDDYTYQRWHNGKSSKYAPPCTDS